jgi:protein TonB
MAKRAMRAIRWLGEGAFGAAVAAAVFAALTGMIGRGPGASWRAVDARPIVFSLSLPEERQEAKRPEKPVRAEHLLPPVNSGTHLRCIGPDAIRDAPRLRWVALEPRSQRIDVGPAGSDVEVPTPWVRIPPEYPPNGRGDGSVLVRFDVTRLGSVANARVVESTPPGMFDRAALRAIERWRYRPAVVDGVPVERRGLQVRLRFELETT